MPQLKNPKVGTAHLGSITVAFYLLLSPCPVFLKSSGTAALVLSQETLIKSLRSVRPKGDTW